MIEYVFRVFFETYNCYFEIKEADDRHQIKVMKTSGASQKMEDINIVVAGEAGQGIQSIESVTVAALKKNGYHVFATKEYMSRVRGGVNSTTIRTASYPVRSYRAIIDVCVALGNDAIAHLGKRIAQHTVIIGDREVVRDPRLLHVPFKQVASELGNPLFANTIASGVIFGLIGADESVLMETIRSHFLSKGEEVVNSNNLAAKKGFSLGAGLAAKTQIRPALVKDQARKDDLLLDGGDAVALGALAGGCNAIFGYPMTPSTTVFTYLAGYSKERDMVVEQVEDEIGVINMALGAWYAGARALVTTSGGGFALMTEGVSLAGITETPVVIHLAQRPGPATGLPTRTMQGDLNLALYAGHGNFPRIVFAPRDTRDAFLLSHLAFNLADKYQVPVFILTDQYFIDSYYDIPAIDTGSLANVYHPIETGEDYKRYKLTPDGVSPRGVPGFGKGLVCSDSDEHDEDGKITEDLDGVRVAMVRKRLDKARVLLQDAVAPVYHGDAGAKTLIVGWGSTYCGIREALDAIDDKRIAHLHFSQVYPLPLQSLHCICGAKNVVVVENNETGQFADLLALELGTRLTKRILKSNGMPFSVEELCDEIRKLGR
jgi:2-oxoglutarate ferredoxin oxidoreductase subunit alpha